MNTEERIAALEKRVEQLEQEIVPLIAATRCDTCGVNRACEEHECHGDWQERGIRCNCCRDCTHECAMSV